MRWMFVGLWSGLFLIHALLYLLLIPPWQAPDEPTSIELLLTIESRRRLVSPADEDPTIQREIVASMARARYWDLGGYGRRPRVPDPIFKDVYACCGTQLHRPPLYHLLLLPVADLTQTWPLEQRLVMLRAATLTLGMATVALATLVGFELAVMHPALALVLPALVVFHPQLAYSSATFNSDNLVALVGAAIFLTLLRLLRHGLSLKRLAVLGLLVVLGFGTKRTILFLLPALVVGVGWQALLVWRAKPSARRLPLAVLGLLLAVAVVVGMPGLRVLVLKLLNRFIFFEGIATQLRYILTTYGSASVSLGTLALMSLRFLNQSFWGSFGWHQVHMPRAVQYVLLTLVVVTWSVSLAWIVLRRSSIPAWLRRYLSLSVLTIVVAISIALINAPPPLMPQGRYLFPALIPIMTLIAIGLCAWWPRRWTAYGVSLVWLALMALDVYTIAGVVIPGFYS
ncbi:MAG TPA: hypothetical protein VFZ66_08020 [Herpetosiphonaceae bacterium]